MFRRGRHRTSLPFRLLAAFAALLVAGGITVAAGTAFADDDSGSGILGALTSSDSGSDEGGDSSGDDGSGDDGSGDGQGGDEKAGDQEGGRNDDVQDRGGQDGQGEDGKDEVGQDDPGQDDPGTAADDNEDKDEQFPGREQASPPAEDDFVDIASVEPGSDPGKGGVFGGGSYTSDCGTSEHRNSDNYQAAPGKRNGAQHVHDYVGNTTTNAGSDSDSLAAGDTSCTNGDKSTFYWPVIRDLNGVGADANEDGGGKDGNEGAILTPSSAEMTFFGHPGQEVQPMPQNMKIITGDAKAKTNGDEKVNAKWTCSGSTDRVSEKYTVCPSGSNLMRFIDFPSCWDGENLESEDSSHVEFPGADGRCDEGRVALPQLRMTLTYDQPEGRSFAMDSFPDQQHDPRTEHGNFENLMSEDLAAEAARCINSGRTC